MPSSSPSSQMLQWGRALLRGKGSAAPFSFALDSGFNGAAHYCAEKDGVGASGGPDAAGFNGAAHYCAEKVTGDIRYVGKTKASMGPRITARKRVALAEAYWAVAQLQWGRALLRGKGRGSA